MGQRLIDANELSKLFDAEFKQTMKLIWSGEKQLDNLAEGFAEAIRVAKYIAPTVDAVPVVRCRECEHGYEGISGWFCSYGPCVDCEVPDSFFCSYGERRDEGDAEMHSANG